MRLIDADKLKQHYSWWKGGGREMTMDEAKHDFDTIVDLQPTVSPRKGIWVFKDAWDNWPHCSNCGHEVDFFKEDSYNFCPKCGSQNEVRHNEDSNLQRNT